jgi:hypothetical protein
MSGPFAWEEWEDKVRQLHRGATLDRYVVRLRHWRKREAHRARGGEAGEVQRVALYHSEAQPRDRPRVVFEVPVDADLSSIEDGALVVVEGWPDPGGAVAFEVDGQRVLSATPGELPLFGAPRFGGRKA